MEIREVKIEEYWPQIVKDTAEFGQIAVALNPEFNKLAKCIYEVLNESFVATASEFGVSRWESILGISPAAGDTLDDRKARILTYLNIKLPYTWRVLKQMLTEFLGEDGFTMDYVNDTATLTIWHRADADANATVENLLSKVLPMNVVYELFWPKYATCVTSSDMLAVDANYRQDLTEDGTWVYDLTSLTDGDYAFYNLSKLTSFNGELPALSSARDMFSKTGLTSWNTPLPVLSVGAYMFRKTSITSWNMDLPSLYNGYSMFEECKALTSFEGDMPNLTEAKYMFWRSNKLSSFKGDVSKLRFGTYMFQGCSLTSFENDLGQLYTGDYMFRSCPLTNFKISLKTLSSGTYMFAGCPLRNFESELGQLYAGDYMFNVCKLNKESALRILNSLTKWVNGTHKLTIGIHVDHKNDEEVLAAITNAESKNWTITVQWNGTATAASTASTFGLRGQPIYAKVGEMELPDGTTEQVLDWGHYVTDSTGYMEFSSVEEAEEYFKLTRIENND